MRCLDCWPHIVWMKSHGALRLHICKNIHFNEIRLQPYDSPAVTVNVIFLLPTSRCLSESLFAAPPSSKECLLG